MKKKQIIGIVVIVLIVLGVGSFILLRGGQKESQQENKEEQTTVEGDVKPDAKEEAQSEAKPEQKDEEQSETKPEQKDEVQNEAKPDTKGDSIGEQLKSESSDIHSWFEEEAETPEVKDDKFPYQIPNTSLSIRAVKSYSGVFIEDGSDKDVSGIAAIILDNKGTENIEYAKITLKCEGKEYVFEAKTLAAGATMVVQESTGAKYMDGEYGEASAMIAPMEKLDMSEQSIKVKETESGAIQIANISGKDIPCVRVFYKFYIDDVDVSVGGITYTAKITDLQANEVRIITPSHYDKDASRVMMVRTYDTY